MYYHKINSLYKREMEKKGHPIIIGEYSNPTYEMLKDIVWSGWEKIDGTNIVVEYNNVLNKITIHGRTIKSIVPKELQEKIHEILPLKKLKEVFADNEISNIFLYGEGISHKIQSGGNYFKEGKGWDFVLFDIQIGHWWLKDGDVTDIAFLFKIKRAPFVMYGTLKEMEEIVSKGLKSNFGDFYAEGIVAKPIHQLFERNMNRIITKIKHKDFYKG